METAKNTLENFISEMKSYELERKEKKEKYGSEYILKKKNHQEALEKIISIQEKFLSSKALSLKQDRRTTLTFRNPPEYDQTIISENLINKNKVEILTSDNSEQVHQYKYTLILEEGLWKIDKVAYSWMNWKSTRQNF